MDNEISCQMTAPPMGQHTIERAARMTEAPRGDDGDGEQRCMSPRRIKDGKYRDTVAKLLTSKMIEAPQGNEGDGEQRCVSPRRREDGEDGGIVELCDIMLEDAGDGAKE